jgi:galactokinase
MALEQAAYIVCRPRTDARVRATNADLSFAPLDFALSLEIPPDPAGSWGNYVKAAAQALATDGQASCGADLFVTSNLPVAAGLSSSSALVIATALALLTANGRDWEPLALARTMALGERYVGTQGGGMDQAICLAGVSGHAAMIEFDPLRLTQVPVPADWRIVVADSLERAEKSGAAREEYNERGATCRAALAAVWHHEGLPEPPGSYAGLLARHPAAHWLERATPLLPDLAFRRFRHAVTEGSRVHEARAAMAGADLHTFGRLMHQSHASLAQDFEVSRPELDALVEIATTAGAAGARLTGAGFGGSVVALAHATTADPVLDALDRHYFAGRVGPEELPHRLFVARPGPGAHVTPI